MTSEQRKKIEERLEMMLKEADTVIPDELRRAMELAYLAGADYALYMFAPHWISVEDELPPADDRDNDSDDCLIVEEDGNIDIGYYNQMDETWFTYNGGIRAVTHWMPLPSVEHLKKGGEE